MSDAVGRVLGTLDAEPLEFWVGVEDGQYLHLRFEEDTTKQAWLYRTLTGDEDESDEPGRPVDLVVALHGAGGVPKNFVMPVLMETRGAWCLTARARLWTTASPTWRWPPAPWA